MKLSERITLLKAGYSKDEINNLIDEDVKAVEEGSEADIKVSEDNDYIKVLSLLTNEFKDLKEAVYSTNITNTNVNNNKVIKAEDILSSLINPEQKEDK